MSSFSEDAIREAAYYIWKNNGCPRNSSLSDWNAAIDQLSVQSAVKLKAPQRTAAIKVLMPKKTAQKTTSLRNVTPIILKPASSLKSNSKTSKRSK